MEYYIKLLIDFVHPSKQNKSAWEKKTRDLGKKSGKSKLRIYLYVVFFFTFEIR
jgi:hypothetical protein